MGLKRVLPQNAAELEQMISIARTVPPAPTRRDVVALRRKQLGPKWGKKPK